jgi:hypothetical protein
VRVARVAGGSGGGGYKRETLDREGGVVGGCVGRAKESCHGLCCLIRLS